MTEKITGILLYVLALVLLGLMVLSSCATPNPKKQKKYWDKFVYYGGKVDTVERTIRITDTIKGKDGRDSIIYRDIEVKCPEPTIEYKDRWHIRRLDKAERDSLKHVEKMAKIYAELKIDSLNKVIAIERQKSKQSENEADQAKYKKSGGWSNPWLWAIILGLLAVSIYLIKTQ